MSPYLKELVKTTFFRYYKANLYKECPFWNELGHCTDSHCSVEEAQPEEIPDEWKALSQVDYSVGPGFPLFQKCEYDEKDFCASEDIGLNSGLICFI